MNFSLCLYIKNQKQKSGASEMTQTKIYNPHIPIDLWAVLCLIQKLASENYIYYKQGIISNEKALSLATKFNELYRVGEPRYKRSRNKDKNISSVQLIMFPCENNLQFNWWLLATPDTTPDKSDFFHTREQPQCITSKNNRLLVANKYELVRYINKRKKDLTWTWQLSKESYDEYLSFLDKSAKHPSKEKYQFAINELIKRLPGFHRLREQATTLLLHCDNVSIHGRIEKPNHMPIQFRPIYNEKRLSDLL